MARLIYRNAELYEKIALRNSKEGGATKKEDCDKFMNKINTISSF